MITGSATLQGTSQYAEKHPDLVYQPLVPAGIRVSGAGFGCYRVDARVTEHRQALTKALLAGVNLIDTSANYADGGSERLVGKVLADAVAAGKITREEVVVVSKVGYLQGENYRLSQQRKTAGQPFEELVLYDDGLEHCIHPDFLADQLTRSLDRLGLQTVDCYLLHNPEYYLSWAKRAELPQDAARAEYLRRIRNAFLHLEGEVSAGRINGYGVSSNTFVRPASHFEFTSLAELWEIAQSISAEHHFRVIQFPLNLLETAALTEPNQPDGKTLLEFARDKQLGVLTNRPLNAIREDRLIRLSETVYEGEGLQQAQAFKNKVAALERTWETTPTLSQLALRALRSTAGITAVLMGMRQDSYVQEALHELRQPCEVADRRKTWQAIRDLL